MITSVLRYYTIHSWASVKWHIIIIMLNKYIMSKFCLFSDGLFFESGNSMNVSCSSVHHTFNLNAFPWDHSAAFKIHLAHRYRNVKRHSQTKIYNLKGSSVMWVSKPSRFYIQHYSGVRFLSERIPAEICEQLTLQRTFWTKSLFYPQNVKNISFSS